MGYTEVDGSQGEGGGQILRSVLSMAVCTGRPVRIRNIRAGRAKPGLMRQHLACVNAAREICGGTVEGVAIGSTELSFRPGKISGGDYRFVIGSAGSTTLVLQTIIPALMTAPSGSRIELEGGTHNPLAPSYDFLVLAYLPVLREMGVSCDAEIEAFGFNPIGAGRWRIRIQPASTLKRLELVERGELFHNRAVCFGSGVPGHVVRRERDLLLRKLKWPEEAVQTHTVPSPGAGNVVSLRACYANVTEVIDSIGAFGVSAEKVARRAVDDFRRYQKRVAPVGVHLADQLLIPMALGAGGEFDCVALNRHARTNIDVIGEFLDVEIEAKPLEYGRWRINVRPNS